MAGPWLSPKLVTRNRRAEGAAAGHGWHRHEADFQIVIMVKGWAKFMYEDKVTLVQAGDCVHQRPGIRHYLFDYSPDMEYLEIVSPADFKTVDVEPVCPIPDPTPWA
jgi:quercetin dioxygenase-like cupin family protein